MSNDALTSSLIQKLNANIDDDALWLNLADALFDQGDVKGLRALFNNRSAIFGTAMYFVLRFLDRTIERSDPAFCCDVLRRYPNDCPFSAATIGRLGYAEAHLFDLDSSIVHIRQGLLRLKEVEAILPAELEHLSSSIMVGPASMSYLFEWGLVSAFLETGEWEPETSLPAPKFHLWKDAPFPSSALACVAVADPLYFPYYARPFVQNLTNCMGDAVAPILVVIDPNEEIFAEMDVLSNDFPRLRFFIVSYQGKKMPEMAASVRFILANNILDCLNRPTVFLDIDVGFPPDAGDVLQTIAAFPLGHQVTHMSCPFRIVFASVLGAQPGPVSRRFFDDAARYFLAKLSEDIPLWYFDQLGLFRSVCMARARGDVLTDVTAVLKSRCSLPGYFVKPHIAPIEKRNLSFNNFTMNVGVAPDGRPFWDKRRDAS